MRPTAKVFTKEHPCTKLDIWNCFCDNTGSGFVSVQVDQAHSIIGVNVPRVMERHGRLVKVLRPEGDRYSLTNEGELWLRKGIDAYMRNHPGDRGLLRAIPRDPGAQATPSRIIRVRPTAARVTRRRAI